MKKIAAILSIIAITLFLWSTCTKESVVEIYWRDSSSSCRFYMADYWWPVNGGVLLIDKGSGALIFLKSDNIVVHSEKPNWAMRH